VCANTIPVSIRAELIKSEFITNVLPLLENSDRIVKISEFLANYSKLAWSQDYQHTDPISDDIRAQFLDTGIFSVLVTRLKSSNSKGLMAALMVLSKLAKQGGSQLFTLCHADIGKDDIRAELSKVGTFPWLLVALRNPAYNMPNIRSSLAELVKHGKDPTLRLYAS
jgi:hypothetical protein